MIVPNYNERVLPGMPMKNESASQKRRLRSQVIARLSRLFFAGIALSMLSVAAQGEETKTMFKRIPLQFIAALGDPSASSGKGADQWGIWEVDPGPRGVWLFDYQKLEASNNRAPANWIFDPDDWWLEENGLIMEAPTFPLAPGKYVVTGDREVITILTIHEKNQDGETRWDLADGAALYDVTHLPCRSARYSPLDGEDKRSCSPIRAKQDEFPVTAGDEMPGVEGCHKQDYAVLFVIGVEA